MTPIQALLTDLGNWGELFNHRVEDSSEDESLPLSACFCTHISPLELLHLYYTALFMDCTANKVNKYKISSLILWVSQQQMPE
jgi:hypothetical protein